jgi:hypothetical protein
MSALEERAGIVYKKIDSDNSGLIGRRELEQLLVESGTTPADAFESLDIIFKQANLEGVKHVSLIQFQALFDSEEVFYFAFTTGIVTHVFIIYFDNTILFIHYSHG